MEGTNQKCRNSDASSEWNFPSHCADAFTQNLKDLVRKRASYIDWHFSNSLIIHKVINESDCLILVRCMYFDTQ